MDLVRTVLLYLMMVVSSATGVSPDVTPIPASQIATPAPYVTATPDPESLRTLAPTAAPTQARYVVLMLNDEGTNVRRLQARLVELGYLDPGSADGKYGPKTKRAVEQFQRKNSLRVDGIAGRETQQVLFDSPAVIYYNSATPTPVPTSTPIPYVNVPVYYVDAATNQLLSTSTASCFANTYISADSSRVPSEYTLVSNSPVQVTVRSGVASPSSVTFYYQSRIVPVSIPVYYVDDRNVTVAQSSASLISSGYVYADSSLVPGYVFTSSTSSYVTVSSGRASVSQVVFRVARSATATPAAGVTVTVQYLDSVTGRLLFQNTVTLYKNGYVYARDAQVPSGYSRLSGMSQYITVQNGQANPSLVQFLYKNPSVTATPAPSVTVPVYYIDASSSRILVRGSVQLAGSKRVYSDASAIPSGYVLSGDSSVYVSVSSGIANPATVVFKLAKAATATPVPYVQVPVRYRYGSTTIYQTAVSLQAGKTTTVYADSSVVAPDYTLSGSTQQSVRVSASGSASPSVVTFQLSKVKPTATPLRYVDVTVRYMYGNSVIKAVTVACQVGRTTTVYADSSMYSSRYVLSGSSRVNVTVSSTGAVSPTVVIFNLALAATATPTPVPSFTVDVPVRYVAGSKTVATMYISCYNGKTTRIYADPEIYGANYVISGSNYADVYVSQKGAASPSSVTFYLTRRATQKPTATPVLTVDVPVRYMNGSLVVIEGTQEAPAGGKAAIQAEPYLYEDEYDLISDSTVYVDITSKGIITPAIVFFYLSPKATPAPKPAEVYVPVQYVCDGQVVAEYTAVCYSDRTNTIYADEAVYGTDYLLDGPDRETVTVSQKGKASPSVVTFYLSRKKATPTPKPAVSRVEVPVFYIYNDYMINMSMARLPVDAATDVTADMSGIDKQYVLASDSVVRVYVSADGKPSPETVEFYLTKASAGSSTPLPLDDFTSGETEYHGFEFYTNPPSVTNPPSSSVAGGTRTALPAYKTGQLGNTPLAVYQGPGDWYFRAENGQAAYRGGTARIYGTDGEWLLIGYMLPGDKQYRIGYVTGYELPSKYSAKDIPQLSYAYIDTTVTAEVKVTDDTVMSTVQLERLPAGYAVTFLAWQDDNHKKALIEYVSPASGQTVRAFIDGNRLACMQ